MSVGPEKLEMDREDFLPQRQEDMFSGPSAMTGFVEKGLIPDRTAPSIKKLSHRHLAILEYMVANPTAPLKQVAAHFGVGQPWLSCIINSDIFRAALFEHNGESLATLRERVAGLALITTERLSEEMAECKNPEMLAEVHKNTLRALGFGPPSGPQTPVQVNVQQNVVSPAGPETIKEARERMIALARSGSPAPLIEHKSDEAKEES